MIPTARRAQMLCNSGQLYAELFGRARVCIGNSGSKRGVSITVKTLHTSSTGRWLRLLGLLLLVAAGAAGCAKVMYNRLDALAAWYVGDLVSLDAQQSADLRSWLKQTLQWHRDSELTRYVRFLRELSSEVAQPAQRSAYLRAIERVEGFAADFAAQTAPEATRLLMELSPAQVEELMTNLEEKSAERAEDDTDEIKAGTWHANRNKSTQRQVKRWTGTVTEEQRLLVRELTQQMQPTTEDWLESQRRWRTALRAALADRDSPEAAQQRILQLLREPDTQWTAQYKSKEASNREQTLALLTALDASLTPAQRERMQRELVALAERLEALTED
jgi:Family of unknown function (DUF6279)